LFSRHYLAVPPGPHLLSSVVLNSPVLASDRGIPDELTAVPGGGVGAPSGGGTSQFEFGVDPTLDPELAMVRFYSPSSSFQTKNSTMLYKQALRMSMEEEAARQAAASAPPPPPPDAAAPAAAGPDGASAPPSQPAPPTDENEEALLRQALALSEGGSGPDVEMTEEREGDEELSEEEMIARAIEMSMHPEPESEENKK